MPKPRPESEALGTELKKNLEDLKKTVTARLRVSPDFTTALAKSLGVPSGESGVVARALVETNGKDIALALAKLDQKHNEIAQELLWQLLPFATDVRVVRLEACAALTAGTNVFELPLRTETLAEIVSAGLDGRCCQFALDDVLPRGIASVPLPAATYAPIFQTNTEHLVDAVVMSIGAEGGIDIRGLRARFGRARDLRQAVDTALRNQNLRNEPRHYLLFIDADIDADGSKDVGAFWEVTRDALNTVLPSLRLVRLTAQDLGDELDVADHIHAVLNPR